MPAKGFRFSGRQHVRALQVALCSLYLATTAASGKMLTGEVQAVDAQAIYVPHANMSPVALPFFVAEGERVEVGDVVLRVDPGGDSAGKVPELEAQIEQTRLRMAKELAELRVAVIDGEIALNAADADWKMAAIEAEIPQGLIPDLDFDRYQGELERTANERALKIKELDAARERLESRQRDIELEILKLDAQRDYHAARLEAAEVRADRDGIVLHGFNNNWIGGRIDEGAQTMPGTKAGEVVRGSEMKVQAWALESDRAGLDVGRRVRLAFDALPGRFAVGYITAIAGLPETRPEWGDGRYFAIDIELREQNDLSLLPGMSVRVDISEETSR